MLLEGKNIVLTGANRGIGNAHAAPLRRGGGQSLGLCPQAIGIVRTGLPGNGGALWRVGGAVYLELTDTEALKGVFRQIMAEKSPCTGW